MRDGREKQGLFLETNCFASSVFVLPYRLQYFNSVRLAAKLIKPKNEIIKILKLKIWWTKYSKYNYLVIQNDHLKHIQIGCQFFSGKIKNQFSKIAKCPMIVLHRK